MAGDVEILYPTPWYKNETFWLGVASSLVASVVFWYFINDVIASAEVPHKNEPDGEPDTQEVEP